MIFSRGSGHQVRYLIGLNLLDDADKIRRVCQILIFHEKMDVFLMRIFLKMVHTGCIKRQQPSIYAVYLISFLQ